MTNIDITIPLNTVVADKFYLYNVDSKTVHDGPFDDVDDAWDLCEKKYEIDLLSNSNPYSIWKGSSILRQLELDYILKV